MKINGQDKNDLLPISADLLLPPRTCLQENLSEQYLLEEFREEQNVTRKLVTFWGINITPKLQAVLRKENIELDLSYAPTKLFLNETIKFIPCLLSPESLVSLNLFNSRLGESGSRGLANVLKVTSSLTYLKISYYDIGKEGALALSAGLDECHSLTALDFSGETNEKGNPYFFDLNLPDGSIDQKIVTTCPQGPADPVDFGLINNYTAKTHHVSGWSLELFRTIGQHPAIKDFIFGVVGSDACLAFLHSGMQQVKGQVVQNTFLLSPEFNNYIQPSAFEVFKDKVKLVNKSMIIKFIMETFMQDSALKKLSLDVHKIISAYLFNLNLGNGAIEDYVDATEEKSQGDDMPIIGDGIDNANASEFSF